MPKYITKVIGRGPSDRQGISLIKKAVDPVVGLTPAEAQEVYWPLLEKYDCPEYKECWSFEMSKRPIPFVSTDQKPKLMRGIFKEYAQALLKVILPDLQYGVQAFNKKSRLGYPINLRFDLDEQSQKNRSEILRHLIFNCLLKGDNSPFAGGYTADNSRTQTETPGKERPMCFVTAKGEAYEESVNRRNYRRVLKEVGLGMHTPPRERAIFGPVVDALALQCWCTLINKALNKSRLIHTNVYNTTPIAYRHSLVTYDIKQYERVMGMLSVDYVELFGGKFEEIAKRILFLDPYRCLADDGYTAINVYPQYSSEQFPQLASGVPWVADLGKFNAVCLEAAYMEQIEGVKGKEAACRAALSGTGAIERSVYSDDGRAYGPKAQLDAYIAFKSKFVDIEIETPDRYLGTVYRKDRNRWMLPLKTCLLKDIFPERSYSSKTYPYLGAKLRRETFLEFGEPECRQLFQDIDELRVKIGKPWSMIEDLANAEHAKSLSSGVRINTLNAIDKEYLMTDEERVKEGLADHFTAHQVREVVRYLIPEQLTANIQF